MNCPLHTNEGAEILLDYCSRHLDPDRASDLQSHVADCTDCRQVVEAQESLWSALDAFEAMPVSLDFDRNLWARIDAEESHPTWARVWTRIVDGPAIGWSNFLFGWKPVVAGAAACAAIAAIMITTVPQQVQTPERPALSEQKIMDRVESALDDVDMLNQIGLVETRGQGAI
jgi:hypothetical protein